MGEDTSQGITRRDLLRRGAVLGGAVVWTTPVVQTLGMGRAFAQTASPTGKDISYLVIHWDCGEGENHTKFENGQPQAGRTPDCELTLGSNSVASNLPSGISVGTPNGPCVTITVNSSFADCDILRVLLKAGSSQSTDTPCQALDLIADGQPHSYCTV